MKNFFSNFVLYYLRFFAKLKLSGINPIIIGVTGSAGKTSCVAAIEAILSIKFKVKTTGAANSESGIPLAILGLKMNDYSFLDWIRVIFLAPSSLVTSHFYDILVCEMGIDELTPPKNMEYLLTIVQPKIGVFLNALPVHTEQMKSVENIFKEKSKMIKSLPAKGTAVINSDYEIETKAKVVKFKDDGTPVPPALAIGKLFGIPEKTSHQSLVTSHYLPPGRGNILEGINGSKIIDSSYNSSPVPTKNALEALGKAGKGESLSRRVLDKESPFLVGRRITVLGDMRELGELAKAEHQKLADVARKNTDVIITVGPLCKDYFPKDPKIIKQFDNFYQAGKFLQAFLQKGDVVLFKGSQNTIFLEGAVEMVLANKSDAAKLCRRGKFWNKQRALSLQNVILERTK